MSKPILGYPKYFMGTGGPEADPFDDLFTAIPVVPADVYEGKVDAVIFWGGEDISPVLYGEQPSNYVFSGLNRLCRRDEGEVPLFEAAVKMGVPIIGVCRGAQLACALSGGKLVQHVTGHGGNHLIDTYDNLVIKTSSVHHQMMWPFGMDEKDYQLLAWSKENRSNIYVFNNDNIQQKVNIEPEIIWFPKTQALAIQGHPEFMSKNEQFVQYCLDLTKKYILGA